MNKVRREHTAQRLKVESLTQATSGIAGGTIIKRTEIGVLIESFSGGRCIVDKAGRVKWGLTHG
jgi:hypothetical protein